MNIVVKIIKQIHNASRYSYDGFKATFNNEFAYRIEIGLLIFLLPAAFYLGETWLEKGLLLASLLLILLVEMINSAIETVVNRISLDRHPLSKLAKDQGSASVVIAIAIAGIIWGSIVLDKVTH